MKKMCAHCGKHVKAANGLFVAYPAALALHHDCARAYLDAQDTEPGEDGHWDGEEWVERTLGVC